MTVATWGLLGPEVLASERRTRTLGLGAVVRSFNDRAVPGLGGVWFGKQLLLATLGVAVGERLRASGRRVQNIEMANAIEALACWLALHHNGWNSDPRLRGSTKLAGKTDLSFAVVRRRGFYVTTPMRQATVQPLRAMGLVEGSGERFNAFGCTQIGSDFVKEACSEFRPYRREVLDHLFLWATGESDKVVSHELRHAVSPLEPLPLAARDFLREGIVQGTGDASRRRQALAWVEQLRAKPDQHVTWYAKPTELDDAHWRDMHAGALFFAARDAALAVLDRIEAHLANQSDLRMSLNEPIPELVRADIERLREKSQAFLTDNHDPSPGNMASTFCRECSNPDGVRVLEQLLARDGRGLRLRGRDVVPGPAFRGNQNDQPEAVRSPEDVGAETQVARDIPLPDNISYRIRNLFRLNLDLRNDLDAWLSESAPDEVES